MIHGDIMKFKLLLLSSLLAISVNAIAGGSLITPTSYKSNTDTENRVYAGLVWTLQEKMSLIPDLTLGFRSLRVKSSDSVEGADISARIKLKDGVAFDSTRLVYVGGERDILGNIGIGYSNTNSSLLGTVAIQGPYSRVGTDFEFTNKKFVPYLEVLTLDKPNKVNKTTIISNPPI
jgi:hypothetical protein